MASPIGMSVPSMTADATFPPPRSMLGIGVPSGNPPVNPVGVSLATAVTIPPALSSFTLG